MPGYEPELEQIVAELNRAATGSREQRTEPPDLSSLDKILAQAGQRSASDVLLIAGAPVAMRINGVLSQLAGLALTPEETRSLVLGLLTVSQTQELQRNKSVDFCFSREGLG